MSAYDADPWATDTAADPWAEPADEAQTNVPAPAPTPTATPSKERNVTVSDSNEAKVVTTIKFGSGFDAPWAVFHSDTVEEAEATLNGAKGYLELVAKVAKFAKTLDSGTAPAGANRGGGQAARPQAANSTPPGTPSKSCAHGEMTYRTGNGAKGPWAGYFCPLEKGDPDQCKPVFIKVNNR